MRFPLFRALLPPPSLALGVCLSTTVACTTLRPVTPEQLSGPQAPDSVRVTGADHSRVVVHAPRVVGDTLEGTIPGLGLVDMQQKFLLSQTTAIETVEKSPTRTAALEVALIAIPAGVTYLAIEQSQNPRRGCGACTAQCTATDPCLF
jgi:hypothetical protein